MNLPNSHEVLAVLEEVAQLTRLTRLELAGLCGISKRQWSAMNKKSRALSPARCWEIWRGVRAAVRQKLDPFSPPVPGIDREWVDYCNYTRKYINALLEVIRAAARFHIWTRREFSNSADIRKFNREVYRESRITGRAEMDDWGED